MNQLVTSTRASALAILTCSIALGQAPNPAAYTRDLCVKVRDGKAAEYTSFLQDVTTKVAKVRMDAGIYSLFVIAQAVIPAGRAARCDYHLVYGSTGFPSEVPSAQQTAADYKKAGIAMTADQVAAKRNDLSYLVSTDIWRSRESVGGAVKGGYVRVNYYKTKPGATVADWIGMESTGWKPLAEAVAKDAPGMGWGVNSLAMPAGTSLAYNAMTVDFFPSWDALGKGIQTRAVWNKVHPNQDMAAYTEKMAAIADRSRVDVLKLVEQMVK